MQESESVLAFANRIRQLTATLKLMKVGINDEERAVAMVDGLPERFDLLISALDALGDEKTFTFGLLKGRLLQEEQRNNNVLKVLFIKVKKVHSLLVNVMFHEVAEMIKVNENVTIVVVKITLLISVSSNNPI